MTQPRLRAPLATYSTHTAMRVRRAGAEPDSTTQPLPSGFFRCVTSCLAGFSTFRAHRGRGRAPVAPERFGMSTRRSRRRSGAAEERDGGARRSDLASPPLPASEPVLRRSQRKSASSTEVPPELSTPVPRKAITLKKIVPPESVETSTPTFRKTITLKKILPQTPEAALSVGRKPTTGKKHWVGTPKATPPTARRAGTLKETVDQAPETPASRGKKSAVKKNVAQTREITLLEKENSLQESAPCNKGSPPLTPAPAQEVTTTVLSPLNPNTFSRPEFMDARDLEMSRKVRRSYSRLDDLGSGAGSTSTPNCRRRSFFGFERLLSGEELENVSPVVEKASTTQTLIPSAEPWGLDSALPGITVTKEKRRKRKVPEILKSELDEWAAAMNAQFEAAEKFDLLVE
ncbi:LOW QUALITY PROTEIN: sororin [Gracilinanus agilis]|uniref:LOW QUALITY PROTEIN: sororin n=1 Tax=Gracilinanus agilis TaxID=191870 RepID=UPI001CFED9EE|nr:LOW QUALITY PROTEIN: sororin [Gracilinanus agilis]